VYKLKELSIFHTFLVDHVIVSENPEIVRLIKLLNTCYCLFQGPKVLTKGLLNALDDDDYA